MRILALMAFLMMPIPGLADGLPINRCINLGNGLDAPSEGDWGYVIERHHLTRIAEAGFDTIRLPVRFSAHWSGRIDPDFLARVDQIITWARQDRLTVILDLHHFNALMEDPDGHADAFLSIWQELAAHYRDAPDDLIFELLNEPTGALTTERAVALYRRAMPLIRESHPERWVIIGGGNWSDETELARLPVFDNRTAHTFHFYDPWTFTHQKATWVENPPPSRRWGSESDRTETLAELARGLKHSAAPVFLGEFGVYDEARESDATEWLAFVREHAEDAGVPWCVWSFASTFRTYETSTDRWNLPRLRALIPKD